MTVTINFRDGSTDSYSNATYTIDGDVLTVSGTNSQGNTVTVFYHWSDVKNVVCSQ